VGCGIGRRRTLKEEEEEDAEGGRWRRRTLKEEDVHGRDRTQLKVDDVVGVCTQRVATQPKAEDLARDARDRGQPTWPMRRRGRGGGIRRTAAAYGAAGGVVVYGGVVGTARTGGTL